MPKISVLLSANEEGRFCAYCEQTGHKKSTLIARLIREHLDRVGFAAQTSLSLSEPIPLPASKSSRRRNQKS